MSDTEVTTGEVVAAINRERDAWEALLAEVGENRMLEPGPMGAWTFKDLADHLTSWRERTIQRLEAAAHGQPEPPLPWPAELTDDDDVNQWMYEQSQDKLLGEVLDESRESYARLAEVVQRLPEEALVQRGYFDWADGASLGEEILNGGYFDHLHGEHEDDIRRWLAEREPEVAPADQVEL